MTFLDLQPWPCNAPASYDTNTVVTTLALTFFGVIAGFGLTSLVQSTLPLEVRKHLIRCSHFFGGFVWTMSVISCSPFAFVAVVAQTYLWGSEPYDNVFSRHMWSVVFRSKQFIQIYWAISSLVVHTWFVLGAAALLVGSVDRPSYIWFAIAGFQCSHIARVMAYEGKDAVASLLEVIGIGFLIVCLFAEVFSEGARNGPVIWFAVSIFERLTHLPAAVRRDASWMKSYDLWLAVEALAEQNTHTNIELPL